MDFSQWLLISEFKQEIYKNLIPSHPQTSKDIVNKILEEIFNSNIEILYENEEQEDDSPGELADPFAGDDSAQPVWQGDNDDDDEHDEISEIEKKYARLKDAMLMLRYKAMRLRKARIYKLKKLSPNDEYQHDEITDLLIKLGYFSKLTTKSDIDKKLRKAYENAIREEHNEYPRDRESLLRDSSIEELEKNVYTTFASLIKGDRILYSGGTMAYSEDTLASMEKIIRMLKTRQVKNLKAQDWSFSKLMPIELRPPQKKGEDEQELSTERVVLGSLRSAESQEESERKRSKEKTSGYQDLDGEAPTRREIENIPSRVDVRSAGDGEILEKLSTAIRSLNPREKIIFCLSMGIKCDSALSPNASDLAAMSPLEVKGQGSISRRIQNALKEKKGEEYVIPDQALAGVADTELFRNSDELMINKIKNNAQKRVFSMLCADEELRNSELVKWIMSVNNERCPGSSEVPAGPQSLPRFASASKKIRNKSRYN